MQQAQRSGRVRLEDRQFSREVRAQVRNLSRCYQCSMCSDGCPVAYAMDYHPSEIIHLVRLGLREKVLQSRAIWVCSSCETCASRCPNDIEIVHLMDVLRRRAIEAGCRGPLSNVAEFHRVFMEQIRKRGRIDEARLLASYELRSGDFLSLSKILQEAPLGLEMLRKGKLKLPSGRKYAAGDVKRIYGKVISRKEGE